MSQAAPAPLRIVLVGPRNPENLGAVARAMKNFGFADWAVVSLGTYDFSTARRVAVHAEDVLDRPRLCATLDEAVQDCAWVVATSSRTVRGRRRLTAAQLADEVVRGAPARTALVFGEERSGLANEHLLRCHDLSALPTDPAQPSVNLAQAVALDRYAIRAAALSAVDCAPPPRATAATDAEIERVESSLRAVLGAGGFLVGPERDAVRTLLDTLRRARLSRREARLWLAALKRLERTLR